MELEDYDNYPGIQYPYSCKAEQTSKGLRLIVHCYGWSEEEVRDSAVRLYLKLGQDFIMHGVPLAKVEACSK
jgi:adenosine deaminase